MNKKELREKERDGGRKGEKNRYVLPDLLRFIKVTHAHGFRNSVCLLFSLLHAADDATLLPGLGFYHLLDGSYVDLFHAIAVLLNNFLKTNESKVNLIQISQRCWLQS